MVPSWTPATDIRSIEPLDGDVFARTIVPEYRPVVIRDLAADWPMVAAGRQGPGAIAEYLARFDRGELVEIMHGPPEIAGRFFYTPDMRGFNFRIERTSLSQLLSGLIELADDPAPPALYAGAAAADRYLPGFTDANLLPLPTPDATPRIWIGNATRVSTHYDLSDNIAVVAAGRRRFTLFPPEQTANLYVGPLNITLAGQPVSMVDIDQPDLDRFPRFAQAMEAALVAELEPGDAIYIPTLWWHNVMARDPVNVLVNYWYNHPPDGSPFLAFVHALLAVRDLPEPQRAAWRAWFDHFIFSEEAAGAASHLPPHSQGIQGPASPARAEAIRAYIVRALGGA